MNWSTIASTASTTAKFSMAFSRRLAICTLMFRGVFKCKPNCFPLTATCGAYSYHRFFHFGKLIVESSAIICKFSPL